MALNEQEKLLCAAIEARRARLVEDLECHVAIPTGTGHVPGLDAYRSTLVERLQRLDVQLEFIAGDSRPTWLQTPGEGRSADARQGPVQPPAVVIARHVAQRPSARVLIAGHLDTVHDPRGSFQTMSRSEDGVRAIGPGVVDMKGGILVALTALEALQESGVAPSLSWSLLLNSDEETGSFHSLTAIQSEAREHDLGIALEPALPDGSLVIERMGSGQFKVEVFGRAAHVGRDFAKGISAVTRLAEIITSLAKLSDPTRGIIINVGPLQGSNVTNAVPDYAACWGNVRFKDEATSRMIDRALSDLQTPAGSLPRVTIHRLWNRPAKPLTPEVSRFAESIRSVASDLGQQLPFASTGGVCDGNIMQAAGLPTLDTLGVRGGELHTPNEYIDLPSLVERCQLLAVLLHRIASGEISVR